MKAAKRYFWNMSYNPGLHLLAEFRVTEPALLLFGTSFHSFIDNTIETLSLTKVGEAYHDFPGGGFTAVVCLTESHLSIHTWPEYGLATFDIFLSNYKQDNDATTRRLFEMTRSFFKAEVANYHELKR